MTERTETTRTTRTEVRDDDVIEQVPGNQMVVDDDVVLESGPTIRRVERDPEVETETETRTRTVER